MGEVVVTVSSTVVRMRLDKVTRTVLLTVTVVGNMTDVVVSCVKLKITGLGVEKVTGIVLVVVAVRVSVNVIKTMLVTVEVACSSSLLIIWLGF